MKTLTTIDHDFVLVPHGAPNDIKRVVLKWDEHHVPFTPDDIAYAYDLEARKEIRDFTTLPP